MEQQNKIAVPGFLFSGRHCGIKEDPQKLDLAVIFSKNPKTVAAGVFTQNKVCAAPVKICQQALKSRYAQLIVINSGIANAATGAFGFKQALETQKTAAKNYSVDSQKIFVCSTGKIGQPLPMQALKVGLEKSAQNLSADAFDQAAAAICTTDAYQKKVFHCGKIGKQPFHIAIMAKGAGMIQPNMATMLCFVMTDLAIEKSALQKMLKHAVDQTLNRLSVDGDTSTNDTVLALANGEVKNKPINTASAEFIKIQKILTDLLQQIVFLIALDGEGATKCFRVHIKNAASIKDAEKAARAVANSQLVKTAVFGCDPNWGRILCAVGYSGARVVEEKARVQIGTSTLFDRGKVLVKNEKPAAIYLKNNQHITLTVDLGLGDAEFFIYASDLTYDYIKINAEYRT